MTESQQIEALHESAVLLDQLPLELIRATGADRAAFLHRLLSGNVAGTKPGFGCHALLLDTKGHVQSDMEIYVSPDHVRIVTAAGQGTATVAALSRYAIMDDFSASVWEGQAALALLGPAADSTLAAAGVSVPAPVASGAPRQHADEGTDASGLWIIRTHALGQTGFQLWGPKTRLAALVEQLRGMGIPGLTPGTAEALRIVAGEPRFGLDITPDRFPMELGLDDAIDYSKGCYLGQEPIVRIRDRGHVNWGLRRLRFEAGAPPPSPGDKLETDARPSAGHITSVGFLPQRAGAPPAAVALALVHNSVAEGSLRVVSAHGVLPAQVLSLKPASVLDSNARD